MKQDDEMARSGAARMARISVWLVALASAGHILGYGLAVPEHIVDAAWPDHARFHVLQALMWLVGFDLVGIFLALGPFARGERWVRWPLVIILLFSHCGYFIALAAVPDGHPEAGYRAHLILVVLLVMYVAGLVLRSRAASDDARACGDHERHPQ